MNVISKLALSLISLIGIIYFFGYIFPESFVWMHSQGYNNYLVIAKGLVLMQSAYLLFRVWTFELVDKSTKWFWTWLLILFNPIASLIYIWRIDQKLADTRKT